MVKPYIDLNSHSFKRDSSRLHFHGLYNPLYWGRLWGPYGSNVKRRLDSNLMNLSPELRARD